MDDREINSIKQDVRLSASEAHAGSRQEQLFTVVLNGFEANELFNMTQAMLQSSDYLPQWPSRLPITIHLRMEKNK